MKSSGRETGADKRTGQMPRPWKDAERPKKGILHIHTEQVTYSPLRPNNFLSQQIFYNIPLIVQKINV